MYIFAAECVDNPSKQLSAPTAEYNSVNFSVCHSPKNIISLDKTKFIFNYLFFSAFSTLEY